MHASNAFAVTVVDASDVEVDVDGVCSSVSLLFSGVSLQNI